MTAVIHNTGLGAQLWKAALAFALAVVSVAIPLLTGGGAALAQSPAQGEVVFQACAVCHSTGTNTIVGPGLGGLADVAGSRVPGLDAAGYVRQSLADPGAYVVDGFPAGLMPNFAGLSGEQVSSLLMFLGIEAGSEVAPPLPVPAPAAGVVALAEGNAASGKNLFTGASRLKNRGPNCGACHSVGGIGALGGGSLGPDLTASYAKLGDAMILWPEGPGTSLTMNPIFSERPLTEGEKADLLALFRSADASERSAEQVLQLTGLALAGVAVIALLTHLVWRKRLGSVRRSVVGG
ncbi:MAG: hypothetical protein V3S18_02085 [Dehalococcoidia bacterium]